MHIRTFRAASLQDALEEIRRQMGPEASVLHTRQVRDGWMGWLGRTYVEVTAGLRDVNDAPPTLPMESGPSPRETDTRHPGSMGAITPVSPTATAAEGLVRTGKFVPPPLPPQLQSYRDALLSAGVPSETAMRWLDATTSFAANLGEQVGQGWLEHLKRSIARELKIGGVIRTQPGDRRVVALIGPTGVGKTTTIAKLAAGFRIEARRRVGLVTIDTFRIAAVQQLKAYAEIMDLPMEVVERPDQMQSALDRLGDVDLVLIDTAGRSPRSDARIDQLAELLRTAQPDETHLVLSATSSAATIESVLQGFAPARPTAAILTKLDEASHTAGTLSAMVASQASAGMPLSYLTNGQQVPDDIAIADAETLLTRLLPAQPSLPQIEAA
ncbi:MAG: flagellar biosynthesis protein FlhF [Pirellulales bacterium]|nr:flagellar biosynthesis protein FlhF [Pirellulales bacterium]